MVKILDLNDVESLHRYLNALLSNRSAHDTSHRKFLAIIEREISDHLIKNWRPAEETPVGVDIK
jgi:hypothetical protein